MKRSDKIKALAVDSMRTPFTHPVEYSLDTDSRRAIYAYRWGCFAVLVFQALWGGYAAWMALHKDIGGAVLCGGFALLFCKAYPTFPYPLKRRIK